MITKQNLQNLFKDSAYYITKTINSNTNRITTTQFCSLTERAVTQANQSDIYFSVLEHTLKSIVFRKIIGIDKRLHRIHMLLDENVSEPEIEPDFEFEKNPNQTNL